MRNCPAAGKFCLFAVEVQQCSFSGIGETVDGVSQLNAASGFLRQVSRNGFPIPHNRNVGFFNGGHGFEQAVEQPLGTAVCRRHHNRVADRDLYQGTEALRISGQTEGSAGG